ncbi:MAG TPA: hypothetical protein VH583_05515 [Vicinamibacterales bacterium]|jgi:spermidine/putrescine-binding protein
MVATEVSRLLGTLEYVGPVVDAQGCDLLVFQVPEDQSTGWATAWRINLWAKLTDGDHAYEILKFLLDPERTYPNMFDAHQAAPVRDDARRRADVACRRPAHDASRRGRRE